jgi:23S rRNA pseudouridine2605 synthase
VSGERLQKILARAGVGSRRAVEELISEGRVTVNGKVAGLGDSADPERDAIKLDGKRVQPRRPGVYLLLNKPRAVMSTVSDPEGRPTVLDLVPPALRKALVPVGRLDFLTEGLLLLTDDGELAQRVAHPRYGCVKTYEAKLRGEPAERDLERLRAGIVLDGRRTEPAAITRRRVPGPPSRRRTAPAGEEPGNSWWTIELTEGRTRQIRDMFQRIGHPVMKLRRVAIGPLTARGLPLGELRELSEQEVETLRRSVADGADRKTGEKKAEKKPGRAKKGSPGSRGGAGGAAAKKAGPRAGGAAGKKASGKKKPDGVKKSSPGPRGGAGGAAGKQAGGKQKPGGVKRGSPRTSGGGAVGKTAGGSKRPGRAAGGRGGAESKGGRGKAGGSGARPAGGKSGTRGGQRPGRSGGPGGRKGPSGAGARRGGSGRGKRGR